MKIDKRKIKRILVITLSNIGDAVLTIPVIENLRLHFPKEHIAILVSPRSFAVFKSDKRINKRIVYDKKISWRNRLALINRLRHERYDLVVDLRNSAFGPLLSPKYRTSIWSKPPKSIEHMKERHLWKLKSLGLNEKTVKKPLMHFKEDEKLNIENMMNKNRLRKGQMLIAIAPGARNLTKPWQGQGYQELIKGLIAEYDSKIVIVGDELDKKLGEDISRGLTSSTWNLCGKTSIGELAYLISRCNLLVSNDSAPMHIAWAMDIPAVAIFGPTDHKKYAPHGEKYRVIRKELPCSPCEESMCPKNTRDCMVKITNQEVLDACRQLLKKNE